MSDNTASLVKKLRICTGAGIIECKQSLIKAQGNIELAIDDLRRLGQTKAIKKISNITKEGLIDIKIANDNKYAVMVELNCETDFVSKNENFRSFSKEILITAFNEHISNIEVLKNKFKTQQIALISTIGENINISRLGVLEGDFVSCYLHDSRIGVILSANSDNITMHTRLIKNIAMHIAASKPEYINEHDIPNDIILHERNIYFDIATQSGKSLKIIEKIVEGRLLKFIHDITLMNQNFIFDKNNTVGQLLHIKNIMINKFIRFELGENINRN